MAAKIKKDDKVIVITGRDKGKRGTVTKVMPKEGRALVQGIHIVTKHQKPTQFDAGGIKKIEAPIDLSNLAVVDPKDDKPTRVGFKIEGKGKDAKKVRFAKRSGEVLS